MRQDDRQFKPTHKLILPHDLPNDPAFRGRSISYRFLRTTATVRNRTQSWSPRLRRRHPVGKTYPAKIIAWRACQANQRVLFATAMDMLNHLLASQVDHSLIRKLKIYTEPSLLLVDGLGYLSLDQQTSNLFYQIISTRHSHKRSTLDWGNILYNTTIATAIADRLVENSEIFLTGRRKPSQR